MRRARLALKGKWPPAASAAAKVASRAEHVPEDESPIPEETPKGGGIAAEAAAVPSPSEPPVTPSPEPAGGSDAGDEPDPVAAASAAAADAAGPAEPSGGALPFDEESRRRQWGQEFAGRFGAGALGAAVGGTFTPGMACATAQWSVVAGAAARIGARKNPPQYLVVDPQTIAVPMQMLAMAWDEQLRRWGLDLSRVEPWMAIAGGTVGIIIACAGSMTTTTPKETEPAGVQP